MTYWTPGERPLSVPVISAPLFIISNPDRVITLCKAGVVGSFPALNARPIAVLDAWLARITKELADYDAAHPEAPSAPFAVNLIVHASNARIQDDLAACVRHKVPIVITSLGARPEVNDAVHAYGGTVLHDVTNLVHARKAIDKGADGLIAVAAGAGGHAGTISPFALLQEIRAWWDGPLILSGAIASGRSILAAQVLGADLAYVGSLFIASEEANAPSDYKRMIVESAAADIIYTDRFSGIPANYLRPSLVRAGLDPNNLPPYAPTEPSSAGESPKAWKDIWGAGQGIGTIERVQPAAEIVQRLRDEYGRAVQQSIRP